MRAEIIFTGNKLLSSDILNSAQYLEKKLFELGIEWQLHTIAGDNPVMLPSLLHNALSRVDLLIITCCMGPTEDSLVKKTVAGFWGLEMVLDEQTLWHVEKYLVDHRVDEVENPRKHALIPRGALVLPNPAGITPGILIQKEGKTIIILPGSPSELQAILDGPASKKLKIVRRGQDCV